MTIVMRAQTQEITDAAVICQITTGGPEDFGPPGMPAVPGKGKSVEQKKTAVKSISCDSVVFSAGRRPQIDECMTFAGIAPKFFIVGNANMLSGDPIHRFPGEVSTPQKDIKSHGIRHGVLTGYAAAHLI